MSVSKLNKYINEQPEFKIPILVYDSKRFTWTLGYN